VLLAINEDEGLDAGEDVGVVDKSFLEFAADSAVVDAAPLVFSNFPEVADMVLSAFSAPVSEMLLVWLVLTAAVASSVSFGGSVDEESEGFFPVDWCESPPSFLSRLDLLLDAVKALVVLPLVPSFRRLSVAREDWDVLVELRLVLVKTLMHEAFPQHFIIFLRWLFDEVFETPENIHLWMRSIRYLK
jgi:hypothetical protein